MARRSLIPIALAVALVAPAVAEEPAPAEDAVAEATTTTTLRGHRGYGMHGDPRGLPTGLPGFSSPPVPLKEGEKPPGEPGA